MTYCLGILVQDGLVMIADTRTNAGVDNFSQYRKLRRFGTDGERLIAIASAGSLSTTQAALHRLRQGLLNPETGEIETLDSVPDIFSAALACGRAIRGARDTMDGLQQSAVNFDATLLIGGSIGGEKTRLFLVYPEGNIIECGQDTPYMQIGELKFGKPMLDRALTFETGLRDALKIGLLSFDATLRSNLAVYLPLDVLIARTGETRPSLVHRIREDDPYFTDLSRRWSEALSRAADDIPAPPYGDFD
ncbi:peptidase [Sphingomonas sp. ID1715]|uniref:peptidase n=1 Tax=Sphingomonas sp. ID1715 TaxID=1656898 RepID=UPI001489B1DB|nr:peptidase [Sphingomonas sp. ID1715]NNM76898.1 peptidase [Sphingomonas sp. ID1715]